MGASRKSIVGAVCPEAPDVSVTRLFNDAVDLFSGRQAGHMLHHCYTGRGLFLWNEFMRQSSAYYVTSDEMNLITVARDEIAEIVGKGLSGLLHLCELGPGSRRGLDKTLALCCSLPPFAYYPRDWSGDALDVAEATIKKYYPDTDVSPSKVDFRQEGLSLPENGRRLVIEFGSSLSNIPGFPEQGLPIGTLIAAIANIRSNLKEGDIVLLGIDQNQDGPMLVNMYSHPMHKAFSENILTRMRDELPMYGFNPEDFEYSPTWHAESNLLSHDLGAMRNTRFRLARKQFKILKDKRLAYSNSYKYPDNALNVSFAGNRFEQIRKWETPAKTVSLFALEAV